MGAIREQTTQAFSEMIHKRDTCRACGGRRLSRFLSLGELPLANSFLTASQLQQPEPRFPLEVYFCTDCALVQLLHVVDPRVLFSNYLYRTGTNLTIAQHNAALAERVVRERRLAPADLVVEVASNDGSLLQCFRQHGVRTLGVEPARNIAAIAQQASIETLVEFFHPACADRILANYGPASVVVANNVLAHVDDTVAFLRACKRILHREGCVVIEAPYLAEMLARLEYDTIYHEHLCYFSVTSLTRLFAEAGLALLRIDQVEIHGGSLRIWAAHADSDGHSPQVRALAEKERHTGLASLATYQQFARRVARNREQLLALLRRLHAEGKRLAAYGAPAKGNTLLCYCGIGADLVPFTVDRSELKVGLYTPGSHIPIETPEHIDERRPDYVLILAWNFAPEIMASLDTHRARAGKFILPIPEPTIV